MPCLFHVSSAANRESILAHGLDWTRMGVARGLAGSTAAEEEGVFLCRDQFEARFFVDMNNTGGPVDVWAVTGVRGTGRQVSGPPPYCRMLVTCRPRQEPVGAPTHRGGQPHARGNSGDRPPGLHREDPGGIAAELSRLAAAPHRW